jgi:hypothetical protein
MTATSTVTTRQPKSIEPVPQYRAQTFTQVSAYF